MENNNHHYQSKFKKLIAVQVVLIAIAAAVFLYISSIVTKELNTYNDLKIKNDSLNQQTARLNEEYLKKQQDFETLKNNLNNLYAAGVTAENEIFEIMATAQATGKKLGGGKEGYNFKIFINASDNVLQKIEKVIYHFDHSTFKNKTLESTDRANKFSMGYYGWGYLPTIPVEIFMQGGTIDTIDFDMAKSLEEEKPQAITPKIAL